MKKILQSTINKIKLFTIKLKIYKLLIKKLINKNEGDKRIKILFAISLLLIIANNLILTYVFIFYLVINLYFVYFLFSLKYKKNLYYIKYKSIIKDKEFLYFKEFLFKLYYSSTIILFFNLFKNNGINYLLSLNHYFIFLLLTIFFIYFILLSNYFTLKLFNLYNKIKHYVQLLNDINLDTYFPFTNKNKINNLSKIKLQRSYSTYVNNLDLEDGTEKSESEYNSIQGVSYEKAKELREFHNNYDVFSGFYGYSDIFNLGSFSEFEDLTYNSYLINKSLKEFITSIPEDKVYSILPLIRFEMSGSDSSTLTLTSAIKVTRYTSINLLGIKILQLIKNKFTFYNIDPQAVDAFLMIRPWLSQEDFDVPISTIKDILNENLNSEINNKYFYSSNFNLSINDKANRLKKYHYDNIFFDSYGEPLYDKLNNNIIGYKLNDTEYAMVNNFTDKNNNICNEITIKDFNVKNNTFGKENLISWIDLKTEEGFIREFEGIKYFYNSENQIYNVEKTFKYQNISTYNKEPLHNSKIGSLDFETYGENYGLGFHNIYAGGWSIKNNTELFYLNPGETGEQLVNRLFLSILTQDKLNGYTFYAHNLGRFDSIFILKALVLNNNLKLTPSWKDNGILSIIVEYQKNKIKLLDSLQLIKGNLDSILISFNCKVKKGFFPYSFVNKENLYYIGDKPSQSLYKNIPNLDYSLIPIKGWDLKKETLIYLKSDIEGLLEALIKFSDTIFERYKLNITKFKTLPSLALGVYTSNYIPEDLNIKMIKGEIEKEIRTSYFGGNVDVFANKISEGYYYDMNSQYPKAMLFDMPVGDPKLSLETNLDKIFGFVYGEITCPNESKLQVPFVQSKDPNTNLNVCPRGTFKRLIFSEEIKYAIKFGYTINIEYCYIFERGKDLFKDYVNYHYDLKKLSEDSIERTMAKLFLNSLYGRMGMKEIDSTIDILDITEAKELDKTNNVTIFSQIGNNKVLVKYSDKIPYNIKKLLKTNNQDFTDSKFKKLNKTQLKDLDLFKKRGVPSAVHIASAIAAYARILINDYKNIPGNPCIMSDTDSVILTSPLSEELIGNELGLMKLEYKIKKAIIIRKKLYYILTQDNREVIKASGIESSKLNYGLFLDLLNGKSVDIERTNFKIVWKNLTVNVEKSIISVKGLIGKVKTLEDLNKINQTQPENDNDYFILFSNTEVILFFLFLFLLIILLIIYLIFFK